MNFLPLLLVAEVVPEELSPGAIVGFIIIVALLGAALSKKGGPSSGSTSSFST